MVVQDTSVELFIVVPNRLLFPLTDTSLVRFTGALWETPKLPIARQHCRDNYRYQDDNATPNHAWVILNFLQQGNVIKLEQPARSLDCNPIEHIWDELGRAITSMDNLPRNVGELNHAP